MPGDQNDWREQPWDLLCLGCSQLIAGIIHPQPRIICLATLPRFAYVMRQIKHLLAMLTEVIVTQIIGNNNDNLTGVSPFQQAVDDGPRSLERGEEEEMSELDLDASVNESEPGKQVRAQKVDARQCGVSLITTKLIQVSSLF